MLPDHVRLEAQTELGLFTPVLLHLNRLKGRQASKGHLLSCLAFSPYFPLHGSENANMAASNHQRNLTEE